MPGNAADIGDALPPIRGYPTLGVPPKERWSGAAVSDDRIRALAVGAFYNRSWDVYHDTMVFQPEVKGWETTRRERAIDMLHESWGVDDGTAARSMLTRLLSGMHSPTFELVHPLAVAAAADSTQIDRTRLADEHREFLRALAGFRNYRDISTLVADYDAWRQAITLGITDDLPQPVQTNTIAWDLARVVLIARGAHTAGYLPEDEAWEYLMSGLATAQRNYRNWRQFGEGFLTGAIFWAATQDLAAAKTHVVQRRQSLFELHIARSSPWRRVALHPDTPIFRVTTTT